jgi:hypothetical protein
VQLVLHGLEERLRRLGLLVVVDAALLVDVGDLEVEPPLAGADLPDPLEQLVEVVLAEALVGNRCTDPSLAAGLADP